MMEILLRLPARTLVSLRSVCRSWRNLISSPDFTRNHLRRSCLRDPSLITPPRIAYCNHDGFYGGIQSFSMQSMLDNPSDPTKVASISSETYYKIVGSCDGLLCFFDGFASCGMHAILWNPCTGFTFESPEISGQVLFCGFGYDYLSDSYKIYAATKKQGPSGFESSTKFYTFGQTSSWRKIDDIPVALFSFPSDNSCWTDNTEGEFFGSSRLCTLNWCVNQVVLYFDLTKEIYGHFSLPLGSEIDLDHYSPRRCTHLYVLRNCLSACYEHKRTREWIVWQMKEYGDAQSWTKLAVISVHQKSIYFTYHYLQPLYISESDVLWTFCPLYGIVLCNLNDGRVDFFVIDRGMGNHPFFSRCVRHKMACIYHESLVSPNGLQSRSSKTVAPSSNPNPSLLTLKACLHLFLVKPSSTTNLVIN
ncbi:hypothetical protein HN51_045635, partial [Arachis hypogaea]